MWLITGLIFFLVAMSVLGLFWFYTKKNPAQDERNIPAASAIFRNTGNEKKEIGKVNALVICRTKIKEAVLSTDEYERLWNGYYKYNGQTIIICQENPDTKELEKWEKQYHPISEKSPQTITPAALADLTVWIGPVRAYWGIQNAGLQAFNKAMLYGILFGLGILGFLYWSSYTGA